METQQGNKSDGSKDDNDVIEVMATGNVTAMATRNAMAMAMGNAMAMMAMGKRGRKQQQQQLRISLASTRPAVIAQNTCRVTGLQ